jgi:hypothetical protein
LLIPGYISASAADMTVLTGLVGSKYERNLPCPIIDRKFIINRFESTQDDLVVGDIGTTPCRQLVHITAIVRLKSSSQHESQTSFHSFFQNVEALRMCLHQLLSL